jgi:hypothetical protein
MAQHAVEAEKPDLHSVLGGVGIEAVFAHII